MAFIDNFADAQEAVRDAEVHLSEARKVGDRDEVLTATIELAGARVALAVLAAADLLSENKGAGI